MRTKIIADFCSNHMGDRRQIEQGIELLGEIGVDYIKFQSFKADRLNKSFPDYQKMYEYYKSVELSDDDHAFILGKCKEHNIKPLFTAFDLERANFLSEMGLEAVKIASPDANNFELIEFCMDNFRDIYISTGMVDSKGMQKLYSFVSSLTTSNMRWEHVRYFYCVSRYPALYSDIDFDKMAVFDGFSDHTEGITAAKKAIDLGMEYIERHFTLGKYLPGKDHFFSSTPDEFKELVNYRNYKESIERYKTRWNNG